MGYLRNPYAIENRSMEIIEAELGSKFETIPVEMSDLVKRVVHTTADFEYAELIEWSYDFRQRMREALRERVPVITDTQMVLAGMNKRVLQSLGVEYHCLISDLAVLELAKNAGITRSMAAIRLAAQRWQKAIFVIGNAPTAIYQLAEMIESGKVNPAAVVGVPVGFVGAAESKELLRQLGVPYITIRGRKGGSTVAVAIVNAILYEMIGRQNP